MRVDRVDRTPPEHRGRVALAELPDGSELVRYANGQYWLVHPLGSGIPGRKMTLAAAVDMAINRNARVPEWQPGSGRFYDELIRERIRRG